MDKINNNFNVYSSKLPITEGTKTRNKEINMPDNISAIVNQFKKASSKEEVLEILKKAVSANELEQLDSITYRCGDYLIEDLLRISGEPQSKILEQLNKSKIGLAPTFVDSFTFGNYTTLITKIDGMNGEDLIPFNQGYNLLDDDSKKSALDDVKKLLNIGVINQNMFTRGNANWFITPKSKKIVIKEWRGLRPVENIERQDILTSCYHTIFNK